MKKYFLFLASLSFLAILNSCDDDKDPDVVGNGDGEVTLAELVAGSYATEYWVTYDENITVVTDTYVILTATDKDRVDISFYELGINSRPVPVTLRSVGVSEKVSGTSLEYSNQGYTLYGTITSSGNMDLNLKVPAEESDADIIVTGRKGEIPLQDYGSIIAGRYEVSYTFPDNPEQKTVYEASLVISRGGDKTASFEFQGLKISGNNYELTIDNAQLSGSRYAVEFASESTSAVLAGIYDPTSPFFTGSIIINRGGEDIRVEIGEPMEPPADFTGTYNMDMEIYLGLEVGGLLELFSYTFDMGSFLTILDDEDDPFKIDISLDGLVLPKELKDLFEGMDLGDFDIEDLAGYALNIPGIKITGDKYKAGLKIEQPMNIFDLIGDIDIAGLLEGTGLESSAALIETMLRSLKTVLELEFTPGRNTELSFLWKISGNVSFISVDIVRLTGYGKRG